MKKRYSFGKQCVAIWLCISLLCGMMLGSAVLPVSAETIEWDYAHTMSARYEEWDLSGFSGYYFAKPAATAELIPSGACTWSSAWNGSFNNGVLKANPEKSGQWALLTYKVDTIKDFEAAFTIPDAYNRQGIIFGGDLGVMPVSGDGDSTNDTGVILTYEDRQFYAGGAIETDTDNHGDLPGMKVSKLTIREKAFVSLAQSADLTTMTTYHVKVENGNLTMWVEGEESLAKTIALSSNYRGGYISFFTNSNQCGFSSIKIKKLSDAQGREWEFEYTMSARNEVWDLSDFRGDYFAKPATSAQVISTGDCTWNCGWNGSYNNGILKANPEKSGQWALLTYKADTMKDFEVEFTIPDAYSRQGIIFGGDLGVMPVSGDGDYTNDTGVILAYEDRQFFAGGAIETDTADHGDLPGMKVSKLTIREKAFVSLASSADLSTMTTYHVKVENGNLTMWVEGEESLAKTIALSENYKGGYISFFTNSNQCGLSNLKIDKFSDAEEKEWDYAHTMTANAQAWPLDAHFRAVQFPTLAKGGSSAATWGPSAPSTLRAYNDTVNKTAWLTESWGSYNNGWLKPMKSGEGYQVLTYNVKKLQSFEIEFTISASYAAQGIMFGTELDDLGISLDDDNTNDTGVIVRVESAKNLVFAGAVNPGKNWSGSTTYDPFKGTAIVNTRVSEQNPNATTSNAEMNTFRIRVCGKRVTVWDVDEPDLAQTFYLSDNYEGGYISYFSDGPSQSAMQAFKIKGLPDHECDFSEMKYDEDGHWGVCSCGDVTDKSEHELDPSTLTCECGYVYLVSSFNWSVTDIIPYSSSKYTVNGSSSYTYEEQTTTEANTIIAALERKFDVYYNSEGRYGKAQHGVKRAYDGQTSDYGRFSAVSSNQWLDYTVASTGGNQNMRLANALVPKDKNGTPLSYQNFETTFQVQFDTNGDGASALFGARQQQPGRYLNGYFNVIQQQVLMVLTPTGIAVGSSNDIASGHTNHVGIQGDFYDTNATATFSSAIPAKTAITVYIKAVGDQMTVKITAGGKTYYEATLDVPYTEVGTFAYGIANRKAYLGDIQLYHLDENGNRIDMEAKTEIEASLNADHFYLSFKDLPGAEYSSGVYTATVTDKSAGNNYVSFPEFPSTQALDYVMSKVDFYYNHQGYAWEQVLPYDNDSTNEGSGNFILFFNKWLQRTGVSQAKNLVDRVNAVVPKLDDGSQIRARNLQVSFHYRFENGSLGTDGNSTAVLALRQKNPAEFMMGTDLMNTDQVLIAITQKSIAVAGGKDITAERFAKTGQFTDDACGDVFSSALPQEIWVEVTAVDEQIRVRISSLGGAIKYDEVFETAYVNEGSVAFGVSGRSGNFGDLKVWRLDNRGVRVDIDTTYGAPTFADGKTRFIADFARLASMAKNGYTTTDDDQIINAWVADKFELYHNRENVLVGRDHLGQSSDVCDTTKDPHNTGYTCFEINDGMLTRRSTKDGGEWMRKGDVLVPKTAYGMPAKLKNFETTFTVIDTAHTVGAVAFSFRNDTPGKIVNAYQEIYANQQAVIVGKASNGAGVSVGGEFTGGAAGDYYKADEALSAIANLDRYVVYVKAVGENVTVRILTEGGAILYENKYTDSSAKAGYLALGVFNDTRSIADWTVTELDENGNAVDFGAAQDAKNIVLNGNRVTVATDDGYMLEAGSLILKDANGVEFVPTRVDFQGSVNGASNVYEVTDTAAVAPFTVADANFVRPTLDNPNIGNVGTSCSEEKKGLRFVSRFSRTVENGTEYLVAADGKFEIVDYGMLVCLTNYLGDRELTLETAAADRFISNMSAKQRGTYYDRSREQVDISVCILNMTGDDRGESVSARAYIIVKDAEGKEVVRYADTFMSTYARNHVSTPAE